MKTILIGHSALVIALSIFCQGIPATPVTPEGIIGAQNTETISAAGDTEIGGTQSVPAPPILLPFSDIGDNPNNQQKPKDISPLRHGIKSEKP